jgi:Family of unknown function (DUF7000)
MQSIQEDMIELRAQLQIGSIQRAYRALLRYMTDLRTHFIGRYPNYSVSGLYQGYLDMTYFAVVPPSLKPRGLKIAIVFNYGAFRFEAWLAATNRQVQRKYWELVKDTRWASYRIVTPASGVDSIIECDLADEFDIRYLDTLTSAIEKKAAKFTKDVEKALSRHVTK